MTIQREIRAELIRRNLTTEALAQKIKISRTALSRKLNGHTPFTLNEINAIATVFGLEDWELLKRKGERC